MVFPLAAFVIVNSLIVFVSYIRIYISAGWGKGESELPAML